MIFTLNHSQSLICSTEVDLGSLCGAATPLRWAHHFTSAASRAEPPQRGKRAQDEHVAASAACGTAAVGGTSEGLDAGLTSLHSDLVTGKLQDLGESEEQVHSCQQKMKAEVRTG